MIWNLSAFLAYLACTLVAQVAHPGIHFIRKYVVLHHCEGLIWTSRHDLSPQLLDLQGIRSTAELQMLPKVKNLVNYKEIRKPKVKNEGIIRIENEN